MFVVLTLKINKLQEGMNSSSEGKWRCLPTSFRSIIREPELEEVIWFSLVCQNPRMRTAKQAAHRWTCSFVGILKEDVQIERCSQDTDPHCPWPELRVSPSQNTRCFYHLHYQGENKESVYPETEGDINMPTRTSLLLKTCRKGFYIREIRSFRSSIIWNKKGRGSF